MLTRRDRARKLASDRLGPLPSFTHEQLSELLCRSCALSVRSLGSGIKGYNDLYLAWFPSGVLKIGVSSAPWNRMVSLPSDALARGIIQSTSERPALLAVVPEGGLKLEKWLLSSLSPEKVRGEYFRGPLATAVAAALMSATVPS